MLRMSNCKENGVTKQKWSCGPESQEENMTACCTFVRCCFCRELFCARTEWPSWLIWIIAVFAQIVEILLHCPLIRPRLKQPILHYCPNTSQRKAWKTVASVERPSRLTSPWACCIFAGRKCSHKQTGLCPKPSSSCLSSYSRPWSPSLHPPHNGSSLIKHRSEFWHHTWDGKVERAAKYEEEEEDKKPWGVYF